MACGEGYGSDVLARSAARWSGSTAIPRRTSTPGCGTPAPNLTFEWGAVETYGEPARFDAVVFLQTIEHVIDPPAVLAHFRRILKPGGVAYVSTPNVLTLAPAGPGEVGQPVAPAGVPGRASSPRCVAARSPQVEMLGLFHARKLRAHEVALSLGWDPSTGATRDHRRVLRPVHAGDRDAATSRCGPSGSTGRSTSSRSAGATETGAWTGSGGGTNPSGRSRGALRIRMSRAGTPPTTALAGTSAVTTALVPITELSPTVNAAQQARAVADPHVVADVDVALVDPLLADRSLDLDHPVVEVDHHHAVGDDALAPDRDVLVGRDRALLAHHGLGTERELALVDADLAAVADPRPPPEGDGGARGRSRT